MPKEVGQNILLNLDRRPVQDPFQCTTIWDGKSRMISLIQMSVKTMTRDCHLEEKAVSSISFFKMHRASSQRTSAHVSCSRCHQSASGRTQLPYQLGQPSRKVFKEPDRPVEGNKEPQSRAWHIKSRKNFWISIDFHVKTSMPAH